MCLSPCANLRHPPCSLCPEGTQRCGCGQRKGEHLSHLRDREGFHKATWARRPSPQTQWTEPIFPIFLDRTSLTASRVSPSPSLRMTVVTSPTPSSILTVKAGYSSWVRPLCTHSDRFTCTHVADARTYTSGGDLCSSRLPDPRPRSLLAPLPFLSPPSQSSSSPPIALPIRSSAYSSIHLASLSSVYLPVSSSTQLYTYVSIHPPTPPLIRPSTHPSFHLSIYLSHNPLSTHPFILSPAHHPSIHLPIHLYAHPPIHT